MFLCEHLQQGLSAVSCFGKRRHELEQNVSEVSCRLEEVCNVESELGRASDECVHFISPWILGWEKLLLGGQREEVYEDVGIVVNEAVNEVVQTAENLFPAFPGVNEVAQVGDNVGEIHV